MLDAASSRVVAPRINRHRQFTSPRLRGEVGSHRRCDPGEGDSPQTALAESPPHPDLLPASGEKEKNTRYSDTGRSEMSQSLPLKIEI